MRNLGLLKVQKYSRYLLSNSKDQTIKVWDLRKFSSRNTIKDTVDCVKGQKWDYRWMPAPPGMCKPIEGKPYYF